MRARAIGIFILLGAPLFGQTPPPARDDAPDALNAVPAPRPLSDDRIFGIIPNFQTVENPNNPYTPLRVRDKFTLFAKETIDPYTIVSSAAAAGISQWKNDDPKYGNGFKPYMQRWGAAQADVAAQNFFSDAVLASLFHEDPRYFRRGPAHTVVYRVTYAISRAVITRRDSGKDNINFSNMVGICMGIGLSNAYYPSKSISVGEMESRLVTSMAAAALGNLLPEFWPDIKAKVAHYRHL